MSASYEGSSEQDGKSPPRERSSAAPSEVAQFVVGPGFEIALRSDRGSPFDMTVDPGKKGPQRPRRVGEDHDHPALARRVELVEASLIDLVDQMEEVERKLEAVIRAAGGPARRAER